MSPSQRARKPVKHGGWPPKYRSNARVSPDHGSEGEDVQMRWRPAHEENSDVIQLYKGLPLLAPTVQNVLPRGVDGRPSWLSTDGDHCTGCRTAKESCSAQVPRSHSIVSNHTDDIITQHHACTCTCLSTQSCGVDDHAQPSGYPYTHQDIIISTVRGLTHTPRRVPLY